MSNNGDWKTAGDSNTGAGGNHLTDPAKQTKLQTLKVDGSTHRIVSNDEYSRLTKTKGWWRRFLQEESPRAVWTLVIALIIWMAFFGLVV